MLFCVIFFALASTKDNVIKELFMDNMYSHEPLETDFYPLLVG